MCHIIPSSPFSIHTHPSSCFIASTMGYPCLYQRRNLAAAFAWHVTRNPSVQQHTTSMRSLERYDRAVAEGIYSPHSSTVLGM
jgi:hypothetical protein